MLSREAIRQALERLNGLLAPAIEQAERRLGVSFGRAPFLGLSVESADALAAMRNPAPDESATELPSWEGLVADDALFQALKRSFRQLEPLDFGLLLLALAPEFNSGYEKVFGFLQDDVTRRRPSVELAGALFDPSDSAAALSRLNGSAPLMAARLVELADPGDGRTGLATKVIRLDEQFLRWCFGVDALDGRLRAVAELGRSTADLRSPPVPSQLLETLERIARLGPPRLYLHGLDGRLNLRVAEGLARLLDRRPLRADAGRVVAEERSAAEITRLLIREANWFNHLLILEGVDALHAPERRRGWEQIAAVLGRSAANPLVLIGGRPTPPPSLEPLGVIAVEIPAPDSDERFEHWSDALKPLGWAPRVADLQVLADRYALTRTQIELAAAEAVGRAKLRAARVDEADEADARFEDLAIAARGQGGRDLEELTNKIHPKVRLDDIVLPDDVRAQLNEIASRVLNRAWVHRDWGFARRRSYGLGVNALFAGPPGTGKTMAAEALARALGKDLYRIDLASVVSKYIGETEQRLEQIFKSGEATQAVLFFDEADSLLGKRSEVKDAHDRYANLEVSYLLQRMERYDGLIILATNLPGNLDAAFLRRMTAIVHFPQPARDDRRSLWRKVWPTDDLGRLTAPLAAEPGLAPDFDFLADRFDLSGGNIANAALAAAFAAADRPWFRFVTMWDVLQGARREFQKLGRVMTDEELGLDQFPPPPAAPPTVDRETPHDPPRAEPQRRTVDPGVPAPDPATGREPGRNEIAAGHPPSWESPRAPDEAG